RPSPPPPLSPPSLPAALPILTTATTVHSVAAARPAASSFAPPGVPPSPPLTRRSRLQAELPVVAAVVLLERGVPQRAPPVLVVRSEEHTSELQSRENLVCRLL